MALCLLNGIAKADIILSWNTFGNTGNETIEASVANLGVAASNLTLGSGVNPSANANRFGGSAWFDTGDSPTGTTLAESISGNDFIQFVVIPNLNTSLDLTSFVFRWDRSANGPSSVALRSSADGFSANLGQLTGLTSGGAATSTNRTMNFLLSGITSTVTFRLYGFDGTSGGTGGFDTADNAPNVILNGTITAIPEPSSLVLVGFAFAGASLFRRRK